MRRLSILMTLLFPTVTIAQIQVSDFEALSKRLDPVAVEEVTLGANLLLEGCSKQDVQDYIPTLEFKPENVTEDPDYNPGLGSRLPDVGTGGWTTQDPDYQDPTPNTNPDHTGNIDIDPSLESPEVPGVENMGRKP